MKNMISTYQTRVQFSRVPFHLRPSSLVTLLETMHFALRVQTDFNAHRREPASDCSACVVCQFTQHEMKGCIENRRIYEFRGRTRMFFILVLPIPSSTRSYDTRYPLIILTT